MKMIYGGTPVSSMKVRHYELNTNDCDMIASDLQAGKTAVARGQKIIGTGKCFEFAMYGKVFTNTPIYSPSIINVTEVTSLNCPIKSAIELGVMRDIDFSVVQTIGYAIIDNIEYPITAQVNGVILTFACDKTIELQYFCGKDNYV